MNATNAKLDALFNLPAQRAAMKIQSDEMHEDAEYKKKYPMSCRMAQILGSGGFEKYITGTSITQFENDLLQSEKEMAQQRNVAHTELEAAKDFIAKLAENVDIEMKRSSENASITNPDLVKHHQVWLGFAKARLSLTRQAYDLDTKIEEQSTIVASTQQGLFSAMLKGKDPKSQNDRMTALGELMRALPTLKRADGERQKLIAERARLQPKLINAQEKMATCIKENTALCAKENAK